MAARYLLLLFMWDAAASADEVRKPQLATDDALLARIAALPDNSWMKLPPVKTAGDLSWLSPKSDYRRQGPRIRDYCNKIVWAPERKRALYCGAGHNVHLYNDVWEYDLASNTWVCLFAPDPTAHRKRDENWYQENVVLRNGVIRTPRGAPLRPAHTWWGLCYDIDRRRLVFWDAHKGLLFTNRKLLAAALKIDPQSLVLRGSGSGPGEAWVFEFDPVSKKWLDVIRKVPKAYESSQMEYLSRHKALWLHSGRTYVQDSKAKTWVPHTKSFNSNGAVSAYDPESDMVVLMVGSKTLVYDCANHSWTVTVENGPDSIHIPRGTFCYDSVAKKFVLFTNTKSQIESHKGSRMWLYDLESKTWTDPTPADGCPQLTGVAGYYDTARNVTVIYSNHETWVYRAKKGP
jgi:hypothetical protein